MSVENFSEEYVVRWADVDANQHLRHSAYSDYAAQTRVLALEKMGISFRAMGAMGIGPILFREELLYKKEVPIMDKITVTCDLVSARKDASRWSLQHKVFREDNELAAIINVDGAWLDTRKRKLATLSQETVDMFLALPKGDTFSWED